MSRQVWAREAKVDGLLAQGYRKTGTWRFAKLGMANEIERLMEASDIVHARANVDDDREGPYWQELDSAAWTGRRDERVHRLIARQPHIKGPGRKEYEQLGWIS